MKQVPYQENFSSLWLLFFYLLSLTCIQVLQVKTVFEASTSFQRMKTQCQRRYSKPQLPKNQLPMSSLMLQPPVFASVRRDKTPPNGPQELRDGCPDKTNAINTGPSGLVPFSATIMCINLQEMCETGIQRAAGNFLSYSPVHINMRLCQRPAEISFRIRCEWKFFWRLLRAGRGRYLSPYKETFHTSSSESRRLVYLSSSFETSLGPSWSLLCGSYERERERLSGG